MSFTIKRTAVAPAMDLDWNAPVWSVAEVADLTCARPESSDHRPKIQLKLLHDAETIYGMYQVDDRYVIAVEDGYQVPVCQDSCVEFFFKPCVGPGYFNLEMNAGGSYLFFYVRNHTRTAEGFVDFEPVAEKFGKLVQVKTTLPRRIFPEITTPVTWRAQFAIPKAAIEPYCGALDSFNAKTFKANFYKCADNCSHPHWITWQPLTHLNYHLPECFADVVLE